MKLTKVSAVVAAIAIGFGLTACGGDPTKEDAAPSASDTLTIGAVGSGEAQIVAEIYKQALEAQGIKVKTKYGIETREAAVPALQDGSIDLLPDYSGNLLTFVDNAATATSPADVEAALPAALPEGLEVFKASPAEDKDSLNVTKAFSDKNGVTSIADLAKVKGFALGANPEFKERAYGIPGLEKVYGITGIKFVPISDFGGPKTLKALLDDDIQVADIYTTTPSITENNLVTLADPENLIAAQNLIPLIRTAKATTAIEDTLNKISAALTTADLVDMNGKNNGADKVAPDVLAKEWLTAKNLL
ncbi:ABC transporter substrate-binding protein [soil metagenome]